MEETRVPRLELSPLVPSLPSFSDKKKVDIRYVVIAPYTSVHVHWAVPKREVVYDIEEPVLSDEEKDILKGLEKEIGPTVGFDFLVGKTLEDLLDHIDKAAKMTLIGSGFELDHEGYENVFYYLYRDFVGLDEIEGLMRDPFVSEISCGGTDSPITVIHSVYGSMQTNIIYKDVDELANFVSKLAQRFGEEVDDSSPSVEGELPDGSKVSVYYTTETTSKGSTFSIKKTI